MIIIFSFYTDSQYRNIEKKINQFLYYINQNAFSHCFYYTFQQAAGMNNIGAKTIEMRTVVKGANPSKTFERNACDAISKPNQKMKAVRTDKVTSVSLKQSFVHSHNTRFQKVCIRLLISSHRLIYVLNENSLSFIDFVTFLTYKCR